MTAKGEEDDNNFLMVQNPRQRRTSDVTQRSERNNTEASQTTLPNQSQQPPSHTANAELVGVSKKNHLGYFSTYALILNKTVGTGIYTSPQVVLAATGSKGISLVFWVAGCIVTWAGMYIYLEYGFRWPVTGGELYYIDNVWTRPAKLVTYVFASMFVLVNGVQANALTFGKEVVLASQGGDTVDPGLQKLIAVISITLVCQLQAYSRQIYVRLSNVLAVYKLLLLTFIMICGFVALGGKRSQGPNTIPTPFGTPNFDDSFNVKAQGLYAYSLALLNVMRAFLGYENANLVLHEVRQEPKGDKLRVYRRALKAAVFSICGLYITANVAFFAACTTEEIIQSPDTLALFLQKMFGKSDRAYTASSVLVCFSAIGAMMSLTFANVRVKQEIARMGLVPLGEFWSETSHHHTPAHALLLHWIFSVTCILITPLENADGFLIMSTFYSYVHTYISVLLGGALLAAPWLKSFQEDAGYRFRPRSLGYWLLGPLIIVYVLANAFVLVLSFVPGGTGSVAPAKPGVPTLPYYTAPVAGAAVIALGMIWYLWDRVVLPYFGYHFQVYEERDYSEVESREISMVYFEVSTPVATWAMILDMITDFGTKRKPEGFAKMIWDLCEPHVKTIVRFLKD